MAVNRASIAKELLPGLNAVFGLEYGQVDDEHKNLYDTENSDRAFEEEVLFTAIVYLLPSYAVETVVVVNLSL